jgi:hypothetical protein
VLRPLLAAVLMVVASAAPAGATEVTLGEGRGGLLALDAAGGRATAVVGNRSAARPFSLVTSDGRSRRRGAQFGTAGGEGAQLAAWDGGVELGWSRIVNAGIEYSVASLRGGTVGPATIIGKGTGPLQLAVVAGRLAPAWADTVGNVALAGTTLTSDAPDVRHLPIDVALAPEAQAPLVLDLAQRESATEVRVLGEGAPEAPVLSLARLEDIDASLLIDGDTLYVGFMRAARAFLATAPLRPDATWSVRRMPGPGGGAGAPAVARAGGVTYVAYGQGSRRRDIYLARVAGSVRVEHLTDDPLDDSRPLIASSDDGSLFVGWTREHRGAETGTALLIRYRPPV